MKTFFPKWARVAWIVVTGLTLSCTNAMQPFTSEKEVNQLSTSESLAFEVIQNRCSSCHGPNSAGYGEINYILDANQLVSNFQVIPSDALNSPLYESVSAKRMPLAAPLSDAELEILENWINAGAKSFSGGFVQLTAGETELSTTDMYRAISKDLLKIGEPDRQNFRYITFSNVPDKDDILGKNLSFQKGVNKLLNSLSWEPQISKMSQVISNSKKLYRINLNSYGWTIETWNKLMANYPYNITYPSDVSDTVQAEIELYSEIMTYTKSTTPVVRGDWLVFAASTPPLYYDLLDLPTSSRELENNILNIDVEQNIVNKNVVRAGFVNSNVSFSNRVIERSQTEFGAYWKSYDFASNESSHNILTYPIGPAPLFAETGKSFVFDGGEIIFNLPNGMQAYMITTSEDVRLDYAPTAIVQDPLRPDKRVANGISCFSCHAKGMNRNTDVIRESLLNNTAFSSFVKTQGLATYAPQDTLESYFDIDDERFSQASESAGVNVLIEEPIGYTYVDYEKNLDLDRAAAELITTTEHLTKQIVGLPELKPLTEGATVSRELFQNNFTKLYKNLHFGPE